MAIKHTKVATTADDGTSEVGTNEWNDNHTIDNNTITDDMVASHTTTKITVPTTQLSGTVTNAQLAGSIANTKLATDPQARANHTGSQAASTISDFDTEVSNNSAVAANTAKVTNATHTGDVTGSTSLTIASGVDATKIADGSVTSTEFQYINTLSSNAQSQINGKSATAGNGSLVTVGALNSGSITSGFGAINNGSSGITTTGTLKGGGSSSVALDASNKNIDNIRSLIYDTSVSGTSVDFSVEQLQTISISASTTFTTANRTTGKSKTIKITTDGSTRTLTFPSGWKFVGTKPTEQAASKIGILTCTCFGTADTDIVAAYAVEE